MYNKFLKLITDFDTIVIYRHSRPDGDALGAQLGLREILRTNFPNKKIYAVGDTSARYDFIGEMDKDVDFGFTYLGIVLDSAERVLISDDSYQKARKLIKIDHHIFREKFGNLEIIDDSYESCCGLVANICFKLKLIVNADAARCLYTGLVTDSGRFRYDSTSSRTFDIASKLLTRNFDVQEIYSNLYNEDLENVLLRAKYTLKMKFTPQHVAYIHTTKAEALEETVDLGNFTRSIVNTMSGIKGIDIWVNFTEDVNSDNVFVEIRSSKYNINPIAVKYGGGGHAKASGATIKSVSMIKDMLDDLDKLIIDGNQNE